MSAEPFVLGWMEINMEPGNRLCSRPIFVLMPWSEVHRGRTLVVKTPPLLLREGEMLSQDTFAHVPRNL